MKNLRLMLLSLSGLVLTSTFFLQGCKKSDDNNDQMNGDYTISGEVQDPITGLPIAGITIQLLDQQSNPLIEVTSDANGKYTLDNVAKGTYSMKSVSNQTYKEMVVPELSIGSSEKSTNLLINNYVAFLPVPNYIMIMTGAVSGLVMDSIGNPVAGANVSISAEADSLTNGYFASTKTNNLGQFKIGVVPIISPVSYTFIPTFKIKTSKDGFVNLTKGVTINDNQMIVINPSLMDKPDLGNIIYSEDFEGASVGWTYTGYWHRQATGPGSFIANLRNEAYLNGFVQLPLGDNSDGKIPAAYSGIHMAWYGDSITGNFLGDFDSLQGANTGGTGYTGNSGSLTSGPISLAGMQQAALYFYNWFEIESVNPNQQGYDIMGVMVINAADSNLKTSLGRMNPYSDPILENRDAIAYTSGGFNAAPTWNLAQFDLTPFVGQTIRIRFEFSTIDGLYNGFRGWIIDDMTIRDKAPSNRSAALPYYPPKPKPR